MANRVLILGLDGASLKVLEYLRCSGCIPNLERIMKAGLTRTLLSIMPPVTGPAWLAMATGMHPGQLGVYDFLVRDHTCGPMKVRPVSSRDFRGRAIWDIASEAGKRVAIFNFPMLFPPYPVNGFMIGGLGASPKEGIVYPVKLSERLSLGKNYVTQINYSSDRYLHCPPALSARLLRALDERERVLLRCLDEPWDLLWVVISETDWSQHFYWRYIDQTHVLYPGIHEAAPRVQEFQDIWHRVDKLVGVLLSQVGPEVNILVVSDHGFGPQNYYFRLNDWLRERGYLVPARRAVVQRAKRVALEGVKRVAKEWGRNVFPHLVRRFEERGRTLLMVEPYLDLGMTLAYGEVNSMLYGSIRFGGGGDGLTTGSLCERLKLEILDYFRSPDVMQGSHHIQFYSPKEMYPGSKAQMLPDLFFVIDDFNCKVVYQFGNGAPRNLFGYISQDNGASGTHRLEGLLIALGPAANDRTRLEGATLLDIAPTVLHLLGLPVPAYMQGKVLLGDPSTVKQEVGEPQDWGAEDRGDMEVVAQRLRGLGYLE